MPRLISGLMFLIIVSWAALLGAPTAAASSSTVTFRPAGIHYAAAEIPNPMRGQYVWSGAPIVPASLGGGDIYYREQFAWGRVEPVEGQFDFSFFEDGLARAGATKSKFGFRVVPYCPGCWTRPEWSWTPGWIPKQAGTDIPDWNSEKYLASWEKLMKTLGDRYRDDPRLGWVDVGGYGDYGEWHTTSGGAEATLASSKRIMQAALDNFPKQHVVINAMLPKYTNQALALSPRMGLRSDCLGGYGMGSILSTAAASSALAQRWKTQPVLSEWCSFGVPSVGDAQVRTYHVSQVSSGNIRPAYDLMNATQKASWVLASKHAGYRFSITSLTMPKSIRSGTAFRPSLVLKNGGSAPTYDTWSVRLQLRSSAGALVGDKSMGIVLRSLLPGSRTYKPAITFSGIPRGTYTVAIKLVDPSGYLNPLRLATAGRNADGAYPLGKITVR